MPEGPSAHDDGLATYEYTDGMCVVGRQWYLWSGNRPLEMLAKRSAESSRQSTAMETCYGHFIDEFAKPRTVPSLIYSRLEASVDGSGSERPGL